VNPLFPTTARVFKLSAINNKDAKDIEYIENSDSPERLIKRMEVSIHTLTNAMVHEFSQILFYASNNRAVLEEVDEDIASDANEAFLAKVFPVGMESVFHWSDIPMKVFPNAGIIDRCEFAKIDINDPFTLANNVAFYKKREFKQTHFQQWEPNDDLIYQLERSNLLIRPQISTLDSYIGTRVHMVLSTRSLIDGGQNREWTRLKSDTLYGPALGTYREPEPRIRGNDDDPPDPQPAQNPVPNALARNNWAYKPPPLYYKTHTNGILYMKTDLLRFVNGEGSDVPLDGFIEPIATIFGHVPGTTMETIQNIVAIQMVNGVNTDPNADLPESVDILAVEYPIHNPFGMFWDTEKSGCKFYMTQIDFIATMTVIDENGQEKRKIILGEYKTLIENNEPYTRVVNKTTILQAYTNALLFQMQTGIIVDMVLILYTTRRGVAYATRLHMSSIQTETMAKVVNPLVLSPGFEKNGVVFYDGRCCASITCSSFPYLSTTNIGCSMLPKMRIHADADVGIQNDLEPIPVAQSRVGNQAQFQMNNNVFWWVPLARNNPKIGWGIVDGFSSDSCRVTIREDIRVSNRNNQLLDEHMFVMFTWDGAGNKPTQADPRGNVRRVQAKTIFRERTDDEYDDLFLPVPSYDIPESLIKTERAYPDDEPEEHKDARLFFNQELHTEILNGMNASIRMRQFVQRMAGRNGPHILPLFWAHMNRMPKFTNRVQYRNGREVGRMEPNALNKAPNFNKDITKTIVSILTRCVQRYINTLVYDVEYLDANNQPQKIDLNCRESKRDGTIRFIHNSQRAYWSDELFEYSSTQLQIAIQAVVLHAIDFRIV
jgi:hypothetical protein